MEYMACPSCGSIYFQSTRMRGKIVFHVNDKNEPVVMKQHVYGAAETKIDTSQIYCGACSWHGNIHQVMQSHM